MNADEKERAARRIADLEEALARAEALLSQQEDIYQRHLEELSEQTGKEILDDFLTLNLVTR